MSSSDSSDEAPEELTFSESKVATKRAEKKLKDAAEAQLKKTKQKRRERDQRLKEQQQLNGNKRKLLSEILNESDSENEDETSNGPADLPEKHLKKPIASKKKTFEERDGVRIEVLDTSAPKKKRLPPPGADAVQKRERFLFRESVPRR